MAERIQGRHVEPHKSSIGNRPNTEKIKDKEENFFLAIDLKKAYDKVDWQKLLEIFKAKAKTDEAK
jgi:hypothetical protein